RNAKSGITGKISALRNGGHQRHSQLIKGLNGEHKRRSTSTLLFMAACWIKANQHNVSPFKFTFLYHISSPAGVDLPQTSCSLSSVAFMSHCASSSSSE